MLIKTPPSWAINENEITPESVYLNRKQFIKGVGSAIAAGGLLLSDPIDLMAAKSGLPAKRNEAYKVKRPITKEKLATTYNNFYEFSFDKDDVHKEVEDWNIDNWKVEIGGLVEKPKTYDVEDLVKQMTLEERVYRFRCVEAWSMVVPWTGFPLKDLVKFAQPLSSAKYVKFTTFLDRSAAKEQRRLWLPWPYTEGLRMDEATNELPLMVTGMYGKPLPKQNGAPIRLIAPWKYGFKSIKSLVKIEFVEKQPETYWETQAPKEYGFYANVNPTVDHPRWSQAKERVVGSFFKSQETLMFNGYEEQVADLYKGMDLRKFY